MEMRQNYSVLGSLVVFLYRSCSERLSSEFAFLDMSSDYGLNSLSLNPLSEEVLVGNGVLL